MYKTLPFLINLLIFERCAALSSTNQENYKWWRNIQSPIKSNLVFISRRSIRYTNSIAKNGSACYIEATWNDIPCLFYRTGPVQSCLKAAQPLFIWSEKRPSSNLHQPCYLENVFETQYDRQLTWVQTTCCNLDIDPKIRLVISIGFTYIDIIVYAYINLYINEVFS